MPNDHIAEPFRTLLNSFISNCVNGASDLTPEEAHRVRHGLCFRCGHESGEHDESCCKGGEDILCRCECFEDPSEGV